MSILQGAVNTLIVCWAESPESFMDNHRGWAEKMKRIWSESFPGTDLESFLQVPTRTTYGTLRPAGLQSLGLFLSCFVSLMMMHHDQFYNSAMKQILFQSFIPFKPRSFLKSTSQNASLGIDIVFIRDFPILLRTLRYFCSFSLTYFRDKKRIQCSYTSYYSCH